MNKKGVSQIVTTILIILLALAAIVIVWQAVMNLAKTPIPETTGCLGLELEITSASIVDNDAIPPANDLKVSVNRKAGGSDSKVDVLILVGGSLQTLAGTATPLGALESGDYYVNNYGATIATGTKIEAGAKIGATTCPNKASYTA